MVSWTLDSQMPKTMYVKGLADALHPLHVHDSKSLGCGEGFCRLVVKFVWGKVDTPCPKS